MGEGGILGFSRKQKLNTGISTDKELVGISDALGLMMWTKYFIEAQGYSIDSNILFQDNQSNILIAKNGRISAVKKSKHIKNRYFLITDKLHEEDLEIRYNPTGEMLADYQSNPHQVNIFCTMMAHLMNFPINYNGDKERRKTHPFLMPKIAAGTKGEELKKNSVGGSMKSNNTALGKIRLLMEIEFINLQRSHFTNRLRGRRGNKGVCWTDTFRVAYSIGLETTVCTQWVVNTRPSYNT